jgi:hypothetical protein
MKTIIPILIGILTFFLLLIYGDGWIISEVVKTIPARAVEWVPMIRLGLWILAVCFTTGIAIVISFFVGGIVKILMDK